MPLRLLIGFQPLSSAISFAFSNSCASVYTGTLLRFSATITFRKSPVIFRAEVLPNFPLTTLR